jgi:precorrin-2 dehydrogenase/sirohydrochlorin ferrochelatase
MGEHLPVLLNVRKKLCVVIGGGEVALRKVRTLLDLGAHVRVVSPLLDKALGELVEKDAIEWEPREYQPGDLEGAFLVVAASSDPEVNSEVRHEAWTRRALVNVVDDPDGSDYQVPSFFEQGPLLVAISTSGGSPAVARTLRRMIQGYLGESFGEAIKIVNDFREGTVKTRIADAKSRVEFWERAIDSEVLEKIRKGDLKDLQKSLEQALDSFVKGKKA